MRWGGPGAGVPGASWANPQPPASCSSRLPSSQFPSSRFGRGKRGSPDWGDIPRSTLEDTMSIHITALMGCERGGHSCPPPPSFTAAGGRSNNVFLICGVLRLCGCFQGAQGGLGPKLGPPPNPHVPWGLGLCKGGPGRLSPPDPSPLVSVPFSCQSIMQTEGRQGEERRVSGWEQAIWQGGSQPGLGPGLGPGLQGRQAGALPVPLRPAPLSHGVPEQSRGGGVA